MGIIIGAVIRRPAAILIALLLLTISGTLRPACGLEQPAGSRPSSSKTRATTMTTTTTTGAGPRHEEGGAWLAVDKRSWVPRVRQQLNARSESNIRQLEVMNRLLEELETLDIEGPRRLGGPAWAPQGQPGQQVGNRLRGRSTIPMTGEGGQQSLGNNQAAFPMGGGGEGGAKRPAASIRHVPCFFNAITCF